MNRILKKCALNATTLKLIAIVLMVFDHVHQMFASAGAPLYLAYLGRPVFPLFLFAAADSWYHTKNRRNYLLRLLFASWTVTLLSEVIGALFPNENVVLMNNAFTVFFVTALSMLSYDILVRGIKSRKGSAIVGGIALFLTPFLIGIPFLMLMGRDFSSPLLRRIVFTLPLVLPNVIFIEGGVGVVAMGLLFYIFRKRRWAQLAVLVVFSALAFVTNKDGAKQWMMIFAALPMALYNGEKGKGMKYFFYAFYPIHIYILYIGATVWKG